MMASEPLSKRWHWLWCTVACFAAASLYGYTYWRPALIGDDFEILAQSMTWQRSWDGLWIPQNEHAMPLGRLLTYVLIQLAGKQTNLPLVAALVGPAALVVGMLLVQRFVRRELEHPFYGLLAMILFGVTAVYQQAVFWFAASFSVIALDMLLLGLLAAQSYRLTGRWPFLLLSTLWCFVAPCWFASGVLAGPLCSLYLLLPLRPFTWRKVVALTLPPVGTALFLAVSLPRTAAAIMHLEHYQMQKTNAVEAFQPGQGLLISLRSIVENLLLGVVGVTQVHVPTWLVVIALLILAILGGWWWRRAPCKRLLLLGVGLIGANYLLVYSARAKWADDYLSMIGVAWSRYHLLPQLGLTLFIVGGLPVWQGRLFTLLPDGALTRQQLQFLACLVALLWLINLPRSLTATIPFDQEALRIIPPDELQHALRHIERVDARCREHQVSAETAHAALPRLALPSSQLKISGWDFLRGSATPRAPETRSNEEIRQLLED